MPTFASTDKRMRSDTAGKPTTIDEYLARVSDDKRAALQRLREQILATVPKAEECISYQLPAFRHEGKLLVFFGVGANHCAFYPGGIVSEFADELAAFDTSKGTIRFQPDKPLPATLVRKIVKARVAQNAAKEKKSPAKAKKSSSSGSVGRARKSTMSGDSGRKPAVDRGRRRST